jgi:hypothetical protein
MNADIILVGKPLSTKENGLRRNHLKILERRYGVNWLQKCPVTVNFRFMVPCIVFYMKCPTRCNTSILILLQDLTQPQWCDQPPDLGQFLKPTLPQGSRSNVTYVAPVTVNCSYCTPDDGYGKYPKHVEWCNKIKILVLHLVGHFVCVYIENDARNHEPKILIESLEVMGRKHCPWRNPTCYMFMVLWFCKILR